MKTKKNLQDFPYVANYPPLRDFLEKIGAHCATQTALGSSEDYGYPRAYLEQWIANGRVFVVEVRARQAGWEIYTGGNSNDIKSTLDDAAKRLGAENA